MRTSNLTNQQLALVFCISLVFMEFSFAVESKKVLERFYDRGIVQTRITPTVQASPRRYLNKYALAPNSAYSKGSQKTETFLLNEIHRVIQQSKKDSIFQFDWNLSREEDEKYGIIVKTPEEFYLVYKLIQKHVYPKLTNEDIEHTVSHETAHWKRFLKERDYGNIDWRGEIYFLLKIGVLMQDNQIVKYGLYPSIAAHGVTVTREAYIRILEAPHTPSIDDIRDLEMLFKSSS